MVCDVFQRSSDTGDAPGATGGEIVHGDEAVLQARNLREQESSENLVVGTAGADHRAQDHPVDAAVMVVRHRNETALLGDAFQLLRRNLIGDADFLEHMLRKRRTKAVMELVVNPVHLAELQQAVGRRGDPTTHPALDSKGFLEFVDFQDSGFWSRFGVHHL